MIRFLRHQAHRTKLYQRSLKNRGCPGGQKTALRGSKNRIVVFAGQYFDTETGLHYNYHRYYQPENGRYLRSDPIRFEGGITVYAYVISNPINGRDPIGLKGPIDVIVEGLKLIGQICQVNKCGDQIDKLNKAKKDCINEERGMVEEFGELEGCVRFVAKYEEVIAPFPGAYAHCICSKVGGCKPLFVECIKPLL